MSEAAHTGFIIAAYAVAVIVVVGLCAWVMLDYRAQRRNLADFDYGVQSFGFGIRYRTPIGPLRIDLSLSPNSPYFYGYQGTYEQLIFGTGQKVVQRINIFQFHFTLGQAF